MREVERPPALLREADPITHGAHHDDQDKDIASGRQDVVTVPTSVYFALLADAQRWRRFVAWKDAEFAAWRPPEGLQALRRITSVEFCGLPECDEQVELIHPLPRWAVAQLPDLSWVRCPMHTRRAA